MIIGDNKEVRQLTPPNIPVSTGDLLLIPPGISYCFVNDKNYPFILSEHKVPYELGLYQKSFNC